MASSFLQRVLLCLGDHRFEWGDDRVLLAVEVVDQHAVEGCRLVQEVASRVLPESGAELMSEQPKTGVDPGHRCVELDVVVFQPDRVVLEGSHPVQQERVHHVVSVKWWSWIRPTMAAKARPSAAAAPGHHRAALPRRR
jgi:hypothetical protein